jgi:geranylgeranyl diphosphate synthase type I
MVMHKTGALFGCALELGALVAGAARERREGFRRFGRALGVSFQLRDDVLGVWGNTGKTGKPAGGDIMQRKKSLPFVMAAAAGSASSFKELCAAYEQADVPAALALFKTLGVARLCEEQIAGKTSEAMTLLDSLQIGNKAGAELREAATFLLKRDF